MEWTQIGANLATIVLPLGGLIAWVVSRLDKKFEAIDKKFEAIDKRFEAIDKKFEALMQELKEIKISIQAIEVRVGRLETQDEERFRNEIKLLIHEKVKGGS